MLMEAIAGNSCKQQQLFIDLIVDVLAQIEKENCERELQRRRVLQTYLALSHQPQIVLEYFLGNKVFLYA